MITLVLCLVLGAPVAVEAFEPQGPAVETFYPDQPPPDECRGWLLDLVSRMREVIETVKAAVRLITWTVIGCAVLLVILQLAILRAVGRLRCRMEGLIVSPRELKP